MSAHEKLLPVILLFTGVGLLLDGTGYLADGTFVPSLVLAGLGLATLIAFRWNRVTAVFGPWLLGIAGADAMVHLGEINATVAMGVGFGLLGGLMLLAPRIAPPIGPPATEANATKRPLGQQVRSQQSAPARLIAR